MIAEALVSDWKIPGRYFLFAFLFLKMLTSDSANLVANAPGGRPDYAEKLAASLRLATTAAELAAVLNTALEEEAAKYPSRTTKLVSAKVINYYAFHNDDKRYRVFLLPKKSGSEMREIKAPSRGLLRLQRLLLRCLTVLFTTCDNAAHGFVTGRSVLTNALPHVGRRFVLNLDLKSFFPSTSVQRIVRVLQLPPFSLAKPVAHLVASLCCDQGCLPQGAPTSPLLTNAVCQRLDRHLRQLARRNHSVYSRYADDLTFSSNRPAFREKFHEELNAILAIEGYQQNSKKQRLQQAHQRQEVTGVIVNKRPNVPREYVRNIRAVLHNWESKGYKVANEKFIQHCLADNTQASSNVKSPKLERVIGGKIAYLSMVRGNDELVKNIKAKFEKLKKRQKL